MKIDLSGRVAIVFGAGCVAEDIAIGWGNVMGENYGRVCGEVWT